jgi:hypothetical protein
LASSASHPCGYVIEELLQGFFGVSHVSFTSLTSFYNAVDQ